MENIYGQTRERLSEYFASLGKKKAKAKYLFRALYRDGLEGAFGISEELLIRLRADFSFSLPRIIDRREDATACKLLLRLDDDNMVETVRMKETYGDVVCVSTQVGCNMGCAFCESGRLKKVRDLTAAEITSQVVLSALDAKRPVTGVTLMGIGEPLDNFDNALAFTEIITDEFGLNIPPRRVTLSTSGLVPAMRRFCDSGTKCNLAVSLHAPNDELRRTLMPVARKYSIREVMEEAKRFAAVHNRRVALEYIMLKDLNDSPKEAQELADLIGESNCYVNIIPYNETEHLAFYASDWERIMMFYDVLKKNKIRVTVRRRMGGDLDAACGQLRSRMAEKK